MENLDTLTEIDSTTYQSLCKANKSKSLLCVSALDCSTGQAYDFVFKRLHQKEFERLARQLVKDRDMNAFGDAILNSCALNGVDILNKNFHLRRIIQEKYLDQISSGFTAELKHF